MMAEFPILMNGFSMRATLKGRKTQTRRAIRLQPQDVDLEPLYKKHTWGFWSDVIPKYRNGLVVRCPYGIPGDYLWARETWCEALTEHHYTGDPNDHGGENDPCCGYKATMTYKCGKPVPENPCRRWKPSIFMPKKYARLWLVNEGNRVERVQGISEEDAVAEGVERSDSGSDGWVNYLWHGYFGKYGTSNRQSDAWPYQYSNYLLARDSFSSLWNLINAKPRPVVRKGKIVSYVSFPWEDVRETREHRGKPWEVWGNPYCWAVNYRVRE